MHTIVVDVFILSVNTPGSNSFLSLKTQLFVLARSSHPKKKGLKSQVGVIAKKQTID